MIIAIDPGKYKCGIAVLDSIKIYHMEVAHRNSMLMHLERYLSCYEISEIVVGGGTGSEDVVKELTTLEPPVKIIRISETDSSLEARRRYWRENPPRGFFRFIPTTMLLPRRPVDDYAAAVLGERYLKG